jgi:hypothetical protein
MMNDDDDDDDDDDDYGDIVTGRFGHNIQLKVDT